MMTRVEPKPGTLAFRALAHLEALPPGTELMTSQFAEALNVSPQTMRPSLETLHAGGILKRRQAIGMGPRAPMFWSLLLLEIPERRDSQLVLKAEPERADATDRESPANASPRVGAMGVSQAADAAAFEAAATVLDDVGDPEGDARIAEYDALLAETAAAAQDTVDRARASAPARSAAVAPARPLRIALWSDGELVIERAAAANGMAPVVRFHVDEVRQILAYLERLSVDGAAAA